MSFPDFHNPYAFVPAPACPEGGPPTIPGVIARGDIGAGHVTHDRFVTGDDIFTGTIHCRLTVEELLLVGGKQTKGDRDARRPRRVEPFQLPDGIWALPSTSLKGMIASVLESATGSTLRVLSNRAPSQSRGAQRDGADMKKSDPREYSLSENRERKPLGYPHDYFRALSPHLVPLEPGDSRSFVTLAETLFGYVEGSQTGAAGSDDTAKALAGRVRFSFARLASPSPPPFERGLTQIMDGPKPPSPSLYFRPKSQVQGAHIPRTGVNKQEHVPKGRKFYLHREKLTDDDWKTRDCAEQAHQKADITAIGAGAFFDFTIVFTNLSRLELESLCWALAPSEAFRHKLGMGRALGLGKVRLQPQALLRILPGRRYGADDFDAPRWHEGWTAAGSEALAQGAAILPSLDPAAFRAAFETRIAAEWPALKDALAAIKLLGDPAKVTAPVHYPQPERRTKTKRQESVPVENKEMERNSYEWFVNNDNAAAQHLGTTGQHSTALPLLRRNTESTDAGQQADRGAHRPGRPDDRGRSTQTLPPEQLRHSPVRAQVATAEAKRSDELVGGIHTFFVSEFKKGKPRFRCTNPEIGLDGSLSDAKELKRLDLEQLSRWLAAGTARENPLTFLVKGLANASFQLSIPETSAT